MPVTKKKGAIFAIYADSPVQSTSTVHVASSRPRRVTKDVSTALDTPTIGAKHERILSPIKRTTKAAPLVSRPRRALGVKAPLPAGEASDSLKSQQVIEKGKGKAKMMIGEDENAVGAKAVRAGALSADMSMKESQSKRPSVNAKSTNQPLMPKSTSTKRLFEVLSGPSSPTRSTTPLGPVDNATRGDATLGPGPSAESRGVPRLSSAKKSRPAPSTAIAQASTSSATRTSISNGASSSQHTARITASTSVKSKSKLFSVFADTEDKENDAPAPTSTVRGGRSSVLDSPASRTRSKTGPTTIEPIVSPMASRGTPKQIQREASKSGGKAAPRRALGDVFVLGDVSEAYGATGEEPEGFKVSCVLWICVIIFRFKLTRADATSMKPSIGKMSPKWTVQDQQTTDHMAIL